MSHIAHTWVTGDVIDAATLNSLEQAAAAAAVTADIPTAGTPTGDALRAAYAPAGLPTDIAGIVGPFRPGASLFNLKPSNFRRYRAARARARAGTGMCRIVATGTSLTAGVGTSLTPNIGSFSAYLTKLLEARGDTIAGSGLVNAENNSGPSYVDGRWVFDSNWTAGLIIDANGTVPLYKGSTASGATATFTSTRPGTVVEVYVLDGGGGNYTISVDGGTATTVNDTATGSVKATTYSGLANTTHTVQIKAASSTSMYLVGAQVRQTTGTTISNAGIGYSRSSWWDLPDGQWWTPGPMVRSAAYSPDLLIVEGPMNDALNGVPVPTSKSTLSDIVTRNQAVADTLLVIDSTPTTAVWGSFTQLTQPVWTGYRQMMYEVASARDVPLLDLGDAFGPQAGYASYFGSDGIHLNAVGYAAWAERLAGVLLA